MLALWTRAAQIRGSCRCPQCLSAAQGVARSTATSAARRPQFWTSSTIWYSGIFAAAASWDALYKVQRREKWDQAIADIKQELGEYDGLEDVLSRQAIEEVKERKGKAKYGYTLHKLDVDAEQGSAHEKEKDGIMGSTGDQAQSQELAAGAGNTYEGPEDDDHASMPAQQLEETPAFVQDEGLQDLNHVRASNVSIFEGDEALQALAANLDSSSKRKTRPKWPENTGSDPDPTWLPPQSIYAPNYFKRKFEVRGWGPYKVERCMISTDIFMLQTWNELRKRGLSQEAASAVPSAYTKYLTMSERELHRNITQKMLDLDRLERMGSERYLQGWFRRDEGDISLCRYIVDADGEFHDTTRSLNQTLRDLVQQTEAGSYTVPALMAKICYQLSLSTAPPNIDTYNSLLVGLFDLRQVKHTEHVIHAMLRTMARPNEVTLATVLNFHSATGDAGNFRWWIQRMRGDFGGLMNASPHTTIYQENSSRLIHCENGKNHGMGTIIQLPYPTPMVFGALVNGVLNFSGFEAALQICKNMAQEGWSLCISGLGTILRDCTQRRDWNSGLTIWKQIQTLKWKSTRYSGSKWNSETIGIQTFVAMLQLCARCGRRDAFENVMDQAIKAHPEALTEILNYVRTDQPVAPPLRMEDFGDDVGEFTSLDTIFPSRKAPLDYAMLAVQLMSEDFPPCVADEGEDAVQTSMLAFPGFWKALDECWRNGQNPAIPVDHGETGT
ncbi:hypothetical protein M409DRAFT_23657 [Zasmidium cellare ATCC 36951]|uniref:Uncharacterized protein n=1 Tax=Zasmidium cellare ATCC 36951 TaxID=1080233 RepID=A0A6A6CKI2_ZASCE|nr:uncharacterized protein M409DRAFT_23657 [Zasmidium cellare ATCC 36951]KAF2165926.1 hypothetical protein M409DRAFT_23657 [Zasmidium cellare ATCC 36951]